MNSLLALYLCKKVSTVRVSLETNVDFYDQVVAHEALITNNWNGYSI